jgi:hypothetical protein
MRLFIFPSSTVENIDIGINNRRWAVPVPHGNYAGRESKKQRTNSKKMKPGDYGLFYSNEFESMFIAPFRVRSLPDENEIVKDTWAGEWHLPFEIEPLGNRSRFVPLDLARTDWPFVQQREGLPGGIVSNLNSTGSQYFVPLQIAENDWQRILADLGFISIKNGEIVVPSRARRA